LLDHNSRPLHNAVRVGGYDANNKKRPRELAMQEAAVDIKTEDGTMNSYIFRPDGDGPFPVVIF
jgi:predicted acyl esterase